MTVVSLALLAAGGIAPVAVAKEGLGRPDVPTPRVSEVKRVDELGARDARQRVKRGKAADARRADEARSERKAAWPVRGEAVVEWERGRHAVARIGGLPVGVRPAERARRAPEGGETRITVLGQDAAEKAGIVGVLLTAESSRPGKSEVRVDYSGFASSVGGGWAGRLRLVRLPACVLETPERRACRRQQPLESRNDSGDQTVSATVDLPDSDFDEPSESGREAGSAPAVLAVTAASAGSGASASGTGDFSATKLSPSSSWQAGGSSGAFTWSYDIPLPPAASDPTPTLKLTYDSGSIDGRTASTNNQGTMVGEGFRITESYIERSYGSCADDGHADVHDKCWTYDNARLVLNGNSTRLVKDDETGEWRLEGDDASKVTKSVGADNGDDDGEYWTVVTGDGTKYVFGLNRLDGAGDERTHSTWTVPVFGDDAGEPGYSAGGAFGERSVQQAWRWNLDYVESTHGGVATYWYAKETNHYRSNGAATADAGYTRGGYLKRIDYGLRKGAVFTGRADARVTFSYAERCMASDCSELTAATAKNWPDVPFDAICSDGDTECHAHAPAFFTRKRMTGVDSFSWSTGTTAYVPVDSWEFTQRFLDTGDIGDSSDQVLTLQSLRRTAKAGAAEDITRDPVSFTYQMRPNRVDATDDVVPLTRPRVLTVTSETGAITTVTLSTPECVRSELAGAAEDTNTRSCYPQYWHVNGASEASLDWFHKYRVLAVVVSDPTGHGETVEHAYSYSGAAWHYHDAPFTPKDERTWSEWRGYRKVVVRTGAQETTRSKKVSLYMQGMDGDRLAGGGARSVQVQSLDIPGVGVEPVTDADQYAGQLREEVTYDGSTPIEVRVNDPWSRVTAKQSVPGAGDHIARFVRTESTRTYTYLTASGGWRMRSMATTFDDYGMPVAVTDSGDAGKSGDETCTRTWYARNTAVGITALTSRTRVVGRACAVGESDLDLPTGTSERGDVLSDTATVYDDPDATGWEPGQKPTKGAPTWTGRATGYSAQPVDGERHPTGWQTVSATAYDSLGRPLSVTDAKGRTSTTSYTPADAGPLTRTVVTNPKGHRTITYLDPVRGQPLRTYDENLAKTELSYDALGRLTSVWLPNRSKAAGHSPNAKYAYQLSAQEPSWVSTSTLKADGRSYRTSYDIYDALLRPLQTQKPTPLGGRVLTDTRYDSRGLAYETYADIFDAEQAPSGQYVRALYGEAPAQTAVTYDGAGRQVRKAVSFFGVERWATTTTYTGDSVARTALAGGSAERVLVDVRGRVVETREYAGTTPSDAEYGSGPGVPYTSVRTSYTLAGEEKTITGPDGAQWHYTYDLFGRRTSVDDPDKGKATTTYNVLDQVIATVDARGERILTSYDELGRITGTWAGSKADENQLTEHTYDSVLKGEPTSATRFVGGRDGAAYTRRVTDYDVLARAVSSQLELPASDPLVQAGTPAVLEFSSYYNLDGTLQNTTEPGMGGLPTETVDHGYNELGQVTSLTGKTGYLLDTDYSALGQVNQLVLGTSGTDTKTYVTHTYEQGTGRLVRSHVTDQIHGYMLQDLNYTFDAAGNVTSVSDPTTLSGAGKAETQCFAYDGHRRLVDAWTPASQDCSASRDTDSLSGPAPYWTSFTYDAAGMRASKTEHRADGGDVTTTYCYEDGPSHALVGTSTTGDCATPEDRYAHDATGNTVERPGPAGRQTLTWSPEGKLAEVSDGEGSTGYLYDADGNLLIRSTESGERVLYAGATELHLRADGSTWAQRHYTSGNTTVAVRSTRSGDNRLAYLFNDHHGTSTLAIAADSGRVTKRYLAPFGAERTAAAIGTWVDDRGFLGKTHDDRTGLTHVGAREYDPQLGAFLSVDPLLEPAKHQSLNGYGYAENNPATFSDPTGRSSGSSCGIVCSVVTMALTALTTVQTVQAVLAIVFSGVGGGGGTAPTSSSGTTSSGTPWYLAPPPSAPPLLTGPDPLPDQFLGYDPELRSLMKEIQAMAGQAVCRPPSGELASSDFGGDGETKSEGPWSLAFRWLWGSPELNNRTSDVSFDGDDALTQSLIESTSMKDARDKVVEQYAATGQTVGEADYSVTEDENGDDLTVLQMVGVFASDFGGLLVGEDDREAQGVLGSYDLDYRITKTKGNTLTVQYHAWTDIDNESLLPGHAEWQKVANEAPQYMGGYFAGFRVDVRWQETIYK